MVVYAMTSESRTASSSVSTTSMVVNCGRVSLTQATKESMPDWLRPLIFTVSRVGTPAAKASRAVLPITPGPTTAATVAPDFARCRAPTPETAPVR